MKPEGHTIEASLGYRIESYLKPQHSQFLSGVLHYAPARNACLTEVPTSRKLKIPTLRRLRQEGCYELEPSLAYIASTRLSSEGYTKKKQTKKSLKMTENY